jgi:hypothetical protein
MQNPSVKADLQPVAAALAELTDAELHALIAATNGVPQIAYGFLVWIEGACDWELSHRAGLDYELLPSEAAIDPSEDVVSINAAIAMQATFVKDYPAAGAPCSVRWRSSTYRVECPQLRHRMSAY